MLDDDLTRLEFATELIREAGTVALGYFGRLATLTVNSKGVQDVVSEADVAVENHLKGRLADRFPTVHAACQQIGVDPAREPIPSSRDTRAPAPAICARR